MQRIGIRSLDYSPFGHAHLQGQSLDEEVNPPIGYLWSMWQTAIVFKTRSKSVWHCTMDTIPTFSQKRWETNLEISDSLNLKSKKDMVLYKFWCIFSFPQGSDFMNLDLPHSHAPFWACVRHFACILRIRPIFYLLHWLKVPRILTPIKLNATFFWSFITYFFAPFSPVFRRGKECRNCSIFPCAELMFWELPIFLGFCAWGPNVSENSDEKFEGLCTSDAV